VPTLNQNLALVEGNGVALSASHQKEPD